MIRLGTVFSGIGSIEQALKRINVCHTIVFACDNGDVELCLLDSKTQKEYKELKTKVGKRTITEVEIERLIEIENLEKERVEELKTKIFGLNNSQSKKEYVDGLYSKNSRKCNYVQKTYLANYGAAA